MQAIEKIRSFLLKFPLLSPLLLVTFFVISGFHEMQDYLLPGSLINPLVCIYSFTVAIFFLFKKITGSGVKSSACTAIILVPLLFFAFIRDMFSQIHFIESLSRYRYFLPFILITTIYIIIRIARSKNTFIRFNQFLFSFGSLIVLIELVKILLFHFDNRKWNVYVNQIEQIRIPATLPEKLPDVYYLLFDMHTGSESLKKYWDYEDSAFTNHLGSKGFCIVKNARSNYNYTLYSIASTFNMQQLNALPGYKQTVMERINTLGSLIRNNKVAQIFDAMGYSIVNFSPFDVNTHTRLATRYYSFSLAQYLWNKTLFGKMCTELLWNFNGNTLFRFLPFYYPGNIVYNDNVFSKLYELIHQGRTGAKPSFVYAHFLLPHYPYYFNQKGKLRSIENDNIGDKEKYLDQLIYSDQLIQTITDSILANSAEPPVIIVQGDHGFNMLANAEKKREANSILNAYYFPDGCKNKVPETITPVNTFRTVFNSVYGFNFKMEENRSFYVDENTFDCAESK